MKVKSFTRSYACCFVTSVTSLCEHKFRTLCINKFRRTKGVVSPISERLWLCAFVNTQSSHIRTSNTRPGNWWISSPDLPIWNAIPQETHVGGGYTQARNSTHAVSRSQAVSLPFWFHWIFHADRLGCTVWSIIIRLIGRYLLIASIAMGNVSNFTRDEHDARAGDLNFRVGCILLMEWRKLLIELHLLNEAIEDLAAQFIIWNSEFVQSPDYCSWMHPTHHSQSTVSIEFIKISGVHRTITARIFRIPANCDLIFMQPRV